VKKRRREEAKKKRKDDRTVSMDASIPFVLSVL
jgi:hypothetical protein